MKRLIIILLALCYYLLPAYCGEPFTLVIDAGHGGHAAGAVGAISKEKNINLAVALAFGKLVEQNCPDVKVVYTRKNDTFVTLQGRADIANRAKANLFVSVHTNAVERGKTVKGFEVYTLGMHRAADNLDVAKRENSVITLESDYKQRYAGFDPNSSESYIIFEYMQDRNMESSVKFAKLVQNNAVNQAGRANKGVHQAGFLVLRETSMPSVLIELGFISTPEEERQLNDKATQERIARAIFNAFLTYRGQTPKAETPTQTAPAPQPAPTQPAPQPAPATNTGTEYRVQIFTTSAPLKANDSRFKGLSPVTYYQEGGLYKYTYGSAPDLNSAKQLRKSILDKFPEAFIVTFRDGIKTKN